LVSSRNIEEMVLVLKKEVSKTHNIEHEDTGKYRQLLVRTLHSCCIRFPDVAATVIPVLAEFLSDTNEQAAADVLIFIREAIQKFPSLRSLITEKLIESFPAIRSVKVHRAALWILGEYVTTKKEVLQVIEAVNQAIGEVPIVEAEQRKLAGESIEEYQTDSSKPIQATSTKVTSDGTYATQSAFSVAPIVKKEKRPPLRQYLMDGDFFIGAALATNLTKLVLKYIALESHKPTQNRICASVMLTLSSIVHLGRSGFATKPITNDDADRIFICLRTLSERSPEITEIFENSCRDALAKMLEAHYEEEQQTQKDKRNKTAR
jgi:coatomer subunit beta